MKRFVLNIFALLFFGLVYAQKQNTIVTDSLYREDQFYAGVSYNFLDKKPLGVSQNSFSAGVEFGFLRDMPINKKRNLALALGLGYSTNVFNHNLLIEKDNLSTINYTVLTNDGSYTTNRFTNHLIDLPFEFRWRTSTPESYDFWRIYTGVKLSYLFASISRHDGDLGKFRTNITDQFNSMLYGITTSLGYGAWNLHVYYALNPLFSDKTSIEGASIEMSLIKFGLTFYFL